MRLGIESLEARFRAPVFAAWGSRRTRSLLRVAIEGDDGLVGYGEAAPLEPYDGVTIEHTRTELERCREPLERSHGDDRDQTFAACAEQTQLAQALAAIDMALWDLAGKRAREPLWQLLGASGVHPTAINATIVAEDAEAAGAEARAARHAGIRRVKLKVGVDDDQTRVRAVRDGIGSTGELRLDANGAWSVRQALAKLATLEPAGIELCEEPVTGVEATRELAESSSVRIAIDETAALPGALERRVCQAVSLKLTTCGGISGLIATAERARAVGYEIYLSSTFDGPLGIAAALHAACALHPERASGLATLGLFDRPGPLRIEQGAMSPPAGWGLGDGLLEWYGLSG